MVEVGESGFHRFPAVLLGVRRLDGDYSQWGGKFCDWFLMVLARSGGRAMQHERFLYYCLDRMWRDETKQCRKRFWKKKCFNEGDTYEMMRHKDGVAKLQSRIMSFAPALPGSTKKKRMDVQDLEAMIEQLADADVRSTMCLFVTHTSRRVLAPSGASVGLLGGASVLACRR